MRKANLCQTLATCQMFNSGLQYNTDSCGGDVKREVEDFLLDNAMPSYFLGVCQDFKHFADELCMFDNVSEGITRFFDLRPLFILFDFYTNFCLISPCEARTVIQA